MPATQWARLGAVRPGELVDTRLALHYAAQPLAAAAYALLPMKEDHSHTNLLWDAARRRFGGRELPSGGRCFLDPVEGRLGVIARDGAEVDALAVEGQTLPELLGEFGELLRRAGEGLETGLLVPEYDLPESTLGERGPFPALAGAEARELTSWFHNAAGSLAGLSNTRLGGAEVRCWPHHFDLAALLVLDPDKSSEEARSVGAGFSPGDGTYAEPYFYVSPWPYPAAASLPELPAGARWHTEGFTAAVLKGSDVVDADASEQGERVELALRSSVDACLDLLG